MYAIGLRICVGHFLPADLQKGRLFVNVSAISTKGLKLGEKVVLCESCRDAEVISVARTSRRDFEYNLG